MHLFHNPVVFLILSFTLPGLAHGKEALGFDVITMKNGDIHNGTVASEIFTLTTPYGNVSIPYGGIAVLTVGRANVPDQLTTRQGDTFSGRVLDKEIKVLRVLDTMLPLHKNDIAEITFAHRKLRGRNRTAPDLVEVQNGDRFLATILGSDFILKDAASIHLVKRSDLKLIDIANLIEGEEPLVQATLNDGNIWQGRMTAKDFTFRVENRYGQPLKIPLANMDYRNGKWIDARQASYFTGKVTPMGYGLGAQSGLAENALDYTAAREHIYNVENREHKHRGDQMQHMDTGN